MSIELALQHARHLAESGVPVFIAKASRDPDGSWNVKGGTGGCGYWLPKDWQETVADPSVVDSWEPGDALCAVMGHVVDGVDIDPRKGGDRSRANLNGTMPRVYGKQRTPSDGVHELVATMDVASLDGFMSGIDIKAGTKDGTGRGFLFIAPTRRKSKVDGSIGEYVWDEAPSLDSLSFVGDTSNRALAEAMSRRGKSAPTEVRAKYDGPVYASLTPEQQARAQRAVDEVVALWKDRFATALEYEEGVRLVTTDEHGEKHRGWELLCRDAAWALAKEEAAPYNPPIDGAALYEEVVPAEIRGADRCEGKFYDGLVAKVADKEVFTTPDWLDEPELAQDVFDPIEPADEMPDEFHDAMLVDWLAGRGLAENWRWSGGLGWMQWDGRRWAERRDEDLREAVRLIVMQANHYGIDNGASAETRKALGGLLGAKRIGALAGLMKGRLRAEGGFDQQPDLLNVGNGVVDLRTGKLLPHDPKYLLTKITETHYRPGAAHPDWVTCMSALDDEVADWMQVRFGQGITGHPTSDDVLPLLQGSGSNGKSTVIAGLHAALGEHMVAVPEKLIRGNPNDHPTELMTLRGCRLAMIDETPEAAALNVARLKAVLGTTWMTARGIRKDNVSWMATHSLFVATNYIPSVAETDHGTWRRLAHVAFRRTFPKKDGFRARMAQGVGGRREAVLAWLVAGAVRWYAAEKVLPDAPKQVVEDTKKWREESDLVIKYLSDRIVFDSEACVASSDLLDDLNDWLKANGHKPWSDKLLSSRFGQHESVRAAGVYKERKFAPDKLVRRFTGGPYNGKINLWFGLRWVPDPKDQEPQKNAESSSDPKA